MLVSRPVHGQTDQVPCHVGAGSSVGRPARGGAAGSEVAAAHTGEVVRRAAKGDERAWAELVGRFGPMLLRTARRTGLSAADAADVQQATWIQFMRRADQIRDPERIGAWLVTTARRESLRIAITSSRQTPVPDPVSEADPAQDPTNDVEGLVMRDECGSVLERALGRLPASYRRVLLLLASDLSPSYQEVARLTDLPVGSIGPMRLRGLQMLRRDLEMHDFLGRGQ